MKASGVVFSAAALACAELARAASALEETTATAPGIAPPPGTMVFALTAGTQIGVGMVAVTAFLIAVLHVVRKARLQQAQIREADAEFERQLLGIVEGAAPDVVVPPEGKDASACPLPLSLESLPADDLVGVAAAVGKPQPTTAEPLVARLEAAGLLRGFAEYQVLHGCPKAMAIVELKTGKRALVVAGFESEAFTAHQLRRFDLVIYGRPDGSSVIVQPLQEFIGAYHFGG